jgi:hypothetical protein
VKKIRIISDIILKAAFLTKEYLFDRIIVRSRAIIVNYNMKNGNTVTETKAHFAPVFIIWYNVSDNGKRM